MIKDIVIINPNIRVKKGFVDYPYFSNIGMFQLVSLLKKKGYNVTAVDSFSQGDSNAWKEGDHITFGTKKELKKEISGFDAAIIVNNPFLNLFGSEKNKEIEELMQAVKPARVILADCHIGGSHYVDYDADSVLNRYPQIDCICKHECEGKIMCCLKDNQHKTEFITDLDSLPLPDYSSINMNNYMKFLNNVYKKGLSPFLEPKSIAIYTSRGCIFNCDFCSSRLNNRKYRAYSLDYVRKHFKLLKEKYKIKKVVILDELVNPTKKRLEELLKLLDELNFCFPNGLRADKIYEKSLSLLKRMPSLSTSAESGCQQIVDNVIGKQLDLKEIISLARCCSRIKLPLEVHFIIGHPKESISDINKTLEFAADLYEKYNTIPRIQFATPIPGSKMFNELNLNKSQEQDLLDNYMDYFSKSKRRELNILLKNFKERVKEKTEEKVIINVTYECNNNCVFCAVGTWRSRKPKVEVQKQTLTEAFRKGVRMVDFDGGEPTLDKNLLQLINYANKLGYENMHLTTNGRLLSTKQNAEKIVKSGIRSILFSLHGPEHIHDELTRAKGSFKQTVQGIKNVMKFGRVDIGVNITLTKKNINCLDEFFMIVHDLGVRKVNIQFLTPFGLAKKEQLPNKRDIQSIIPRIIKKYSDIAIQLVNLPYCILPGYEDYLIDDAMKQKRRMAFIAKDEQNLSEFLSSKRYKDKECDSCLHSIICGGKWDFNDQK